MYELCFLLARAFIKIKYVLLPLVLGFASERQIDKESVKRNAV